LVENGFAVKVGAVAVAAPAPEPIEEPHPVEAESVEPVAAPATRKRKGG